MNLEGNSEDVRRMMLEMLSDEKIVAAAFKMAKVMQTALVVDGEWVDPVTGMKVKMDEEGAVSFTLPPRAESTDE